MKAEESDRIFDEGQEDVTQYRMCPRSGVPTGRSSV